MSAEQKERAARRFMSGVHLKAAAGSTKVVGRKARRTTTTASSKNCTILLRAMVASLLTAARRLTMDMPGADTVGAPFSVHAPVRSPGKVAERRTTEIAVVNGRLSANTRMGEPPAVGKPAACTAAVTFTELMRVTCARAPPRTAAANNAVVTRPIGVSGVRKYRGRPDCRRKIGALPRVLV